MAHRPLRILLVNDDGVDAPGIIELARALAGRYEVYVCAPERPQSATSHSITLHKPLRLYNRDYLYPPEVRAAFACSGSPTDSVALGMDVVIGEGGADLVVSGINNGRNTAEDVTYSGTVAGALEGAMLKRPSLAVSHDSGEWEYLETAVEVAVRVVGWMVRLVEMARAGSDGEEVGPEVRLARQLVAGNIFLNLNTPALPLERLRGLLITRLGNRVYRDVAHKRIDPKGRPYYWIAGEPVPDVNREGTDIWALERGYASLTPLSSNLTAESAIGLMEQALSATLKVEWKGEEGN